jgi:uncharacterized protein (UPF0261 family)
LSILHFRLALCELRAASHAARGGGRDNSPAVAARSVALGHALRQRERMAARTAVGGMTQNRRLCRIVRA